MAFLEITCYKKLDLFSEHQYDGENREEGALWDLSLGLRD